MNFLLDNNIVIDLLSYRRSLKYPKSQEVFNLLCTSNHNIFISSSSIDNIEFIGEKSDLSEVYEKSDLLVFPMTKPHQSRPAFEIGLYSKPVIITKFDNIEEYFTENVNALVFKNNDIKNLAEKIKILYYQLII